MNRLDFSKVIYHPERITDLLKNGTTFPVHLDLGLVNFCNHDCIWCYAGTSKKQPDQTNVFINKEKLLKSLKEMHSLGLKSCTLVGSGEPTLHYDFSEIVESMKNIGIEIGLFTNGSMLKDDKINAIINNLIFIRISLNGATKKTHNKIHGTKDFDSIVGNIKNLVENKGDRLFPTIGIQMGVHHMNYEEIPKMVKLSKALNVDYLEFKPIYFIRNEKGPMINLLDFENVEQLLDDAQEQSNEQFEVYIKKDQFRDVLGKNTIRNYKKCLGSFFSTSMDHLGNLFMCDNQINEDFLFGNVFEQPFKMVWNSQKRIEIYNNIVVEKCPNRCRMHPLNEILEDIKHPNRKLHPNFL